MARGENKTVTGSEIEDAPAGVYRSAVWEHFGFSVSYDGGKKVVDKSATVCKLCATRVVYAADNTFKLQCSL